MELNEIASTVFRFIIAYSVILAPIVSISTGAATWYGVLQRRKNREPPFGEFQRKKDTLGKWFIYVHSPVKPVLHCNATFRGKSLKIRDGNGLEKNIPLGSGCNFDMPENVFDNDDGFIVIRNGKKELLKEKFREMVTTGI